MKAVKKVLLVLLLLAVCVPLAFLGLQKWSLERFARAPFGKGTVVVEVPAGSGPQKLGRLLAEAGVIEDAQRFYQYLHHLRKDARPKFGEYEFALPLSPDDVIDKLDRGEVLQHHFTVPEGLRADEIAGIVGATGLCKEGEFLQLARDPALARKLGLPARSLEGWLFPDTYSVPRTIGCSGIVSAMVSRFREAWKSAEAQRAPEVKLDELQAVTLASIIEKETGQAGERPRISCVFHNRLHKGMKLQTDPTVIYAVLLQNDFKWDGNIHKSDLERPHPYNTYTNAGLPPGPIANPGAAALSAALKPLHCADLFFVSRNDHTHTFCPDLACHEAAVQKWQIDYFRQQRR